MSGGDCDVHRDPEPALDSGDALEFEEEACIGLGGLAAGEFG